MSQRWWWVWACLWLGLWCCCGVVQAANSTYRCPVSYVDGFFYFGTNVSLGQPMILRNRFVADDVANNTAGALVVYGISDGALLFTDDHVPLDNSSLPYTLDSNISARVRFRPAEGYETGNLTLTYGSLATNGYQCPNATLTLIIHEQRCVGDPEAILYGLPEQEHLLMRYDFNTPERCKGCNSTLIPELTRSRASSGPLLLDALAGKFRRDHFNRPGLHTTSTGGEGYLSRTGGPAAASQLDSWGMREFMDETSPAFDNFATRWQFVCPETVWPFAWDSNFENPNGALAFAEWHEPGYVGTCSSSYDGLCEGVYGVEALSSGEDSIVLGHVQHARDQTIRLTSQVDFVLSHPLNGSDGVHGSIRDNEADSGRMVARIAGANGFFSVSATKLDGVKVWQGKEFLYLLEQSATGVGSLESVFFCTLQSISIWHVPSPSTSAPDFIRSLVNNPEVFPRLRPTAESAEFTVNHGVVTNLTLYATDDWEFSHSRTRVVIRTLPTDGMLFDWVGGEPQIISSVPHELAVPFILSNLTVEGGTSRVTGSFNPGVRLLENRTASLQITVGYVHTNGISASTDSFEFDVNDAMMFCSDNGIITLDIIASPPTALSTTTIVYQQVYSKVCPTGTTADSGGIVDVQLTSLPSQGTLHLYTSVDAVPSAVGPALTLSDLPLNISNGSVPLCVAYLNNGTDSELLFGDDNTVAVDNFRVRVLDDAGQISANEGLQTLRVHFSLSLDDAFRTLVVNEYTVTGFPSVLNTEKHPVDFHVRDQILDPSALTYTFQLESVTSRGRLETTLGLVLIPYILPHAFTTPSDLFFVAPQHDNNCSSFLDGRPTYDNLTLTIFASDGRRSAVEVLYIDVVPLETQIAVTAQQGLEIEQLIETRFQFNVSDTLDACSNAVANDPLLYFALVFEQTTLFRVIKCTTAGLNFTAASASADLSGNTYQGGGSIPTSQLQSLLDTCTITYNGITAFGHSVGDTFSILLQVSQGEGVSNNGAVVSSNIESQADERLFFVTVAAAPLIVVDDDEDETLLIIIYVLVGVLATALILLVAFSCYQSFYVARGITSNRREQKNEPGADDNNKGYGHREEDEYGTCTSDNWVKCCRFFGTGLVGLACLPALLLYGIARYCNGKIYHLCCDCCGADQDIPEDADAIESIPFADRHYTPSLEEAMS